MLGLSLGVAFVHYVFNDSIMAYILGFVLSPLLPNLGKFIWLYPFFVGAYLFAKHRDRLSNVIEIIKKPYLITILVVLHFVLVLLWKNDYYIYMPPGLGFTVYGQENYIKYFIALFYRTFAGAVGSVAVILVIDAAVKFVDPKNVHKFIGALSRYSLGIYVFSVYILSGVVSWLVPGDGFNLIIVLAVALAQIIISLIAMIIIDKIKITRKLLLGGR